ncbi:MAG: hypothetical protein H6815_12935 [Phycisphaeraceae bacterium]|nr:hypothetical protein [Phycisphaerales bacterium]MCB9861346.1 hypothetical protein [Phycisphaeraceae bacterium]
MPTEPASADQVAYCHAVAVLVPGRSRLLLALNVNSLKSLLNPKRGKDPSLTLPEVPQFIKEEFGLNGLALSADLLAGSNRRDLEAFRERSDRAGCACLLLHETTPLELGSLNEAVAEQACDRLDRILHAGRFLGTNSVAFTPAAGKDEDELDFTAEAIKRAMGLAEKHEMNLLIYPAQGLTSTPDDVTNLLKRVGGFRVGTFPDFEYASTFDDPAGYLKKMCPYASAISASMLDFVVPESEPERKKPTKKTKAPAKSAAQTDESEVPTDSVKETDEALDELDEFLDELDEMWEPPVHTAFDIQPMVGAVLAVGYDGALIIDYRGKGNPADGVQNCIYALEDAVRAEVEKS